MIKLYNTFTRRKEEFKPVVEGNVGMYVCGPTVYGMPHLGHAKSYINFDTIFRFFKFLGYKVKYVQNITDVGHLVGDGDDGEDKIAKQAKLEKLDAYEIAYKYEVEYFNSMDKLNVLRPSISCRATGFVHDMIETVKDIVNKGYGYVTKEGNVYFDVRKYNAYGQLSNRKLDEAVSGERIEVATDKRNPEDFALWKAVDENTLMQWDSPWGKGCPGWHIECTTLGKKFLGEKFDIHGGGIDNIFPHHECECAQADVVNGHLPMNYFMHNGLVTVNGTKMGKSLGNFITLPDLFKKYDPMVVRFFILQFHYRSNVDFSDDGLNLANKQFEKITQVVNELRSKSAEVATQVTTPELQEIYNGFVSAMSEDFNTPVAVVEFNKLIKAVSAALSSNNTSVYPELNLMVNSFAEDVFGLSFPKSSSVKENKAEAVPAEVSLLAQKRWEAKQNKNWTEADSLREQIKNFGYVIVDSKEGYKLEKI
ncbi:MAG: cysteine--tRNA ligase [Clostridia bacterium]|nr:cysteine--tRNA ligase [Clostridia bacterium]